MNEKEKDKLIKRLLKHLNKKYGRAFKRLAKLLGDGEDGNPAMLQTVRTRFDSGVAY